jgi:hypothetical protein
MITLPIKFPEKASRRRSGGLREWLTLSGPSLAGGIDA